MLVREYRIRERDTTPHSEMMGQSSLALSCQLHMIYWERYCRRLSVLDLNYDNMGVVTQYVDGSYSPMLEFPLGVPPSDTAADLWCVVHRQNNWV